MAVVINGGLDVRWPSLADLRQGPHATVAAALAAIPESRRAAGLIVFVIDPENANEILSYQFKGGIADENLVPYTPGTGASYKEFVAMVSQSGDGVPLATIIHNSLGGTIEWSVVSDGIFDGTLAGAFPEGKVFIPQSVYATLDGTKKYTVTRTGANTIRLITLNGMTPENNVIPGEVPIEIRVYN